MIPVRIRWFSFAFVVGALACSPPKGSNATTDSALAAADHTRADSIFRVVASDTTRFPAGRLRLKVTEDVPQSRHR
jgi:hypothetical protein